MIRKTKSTSKNIISKNGISKKRVYSNKSGQTFIELIITIFAFFTILFMFVQVALGLGVANYIQYATFMAARALLSSHATVREQTTVAQEVLESMVKQNGNDRFKGIAQGTGEGDSPGINVVAQGPRSNLTPRDWAWEKGVAYKFKIKFYMMPLVPGAKKGAANRLELDSESWLGREPTEDECKATLQTMRSRSGATQVIYDNGC